MCERLKNWKNENRRKRNVSYITCRQKKGRHKVHVSVCENCKGMTCPDYYNYMQRSLFPRSIPDEKIRQKFQPEQSSDDYRSDAKSPEQMSWLKKTGSSFSAKKNYPALPK